MARRLASASCSSVMKWWLDKLEKRSTRRILDQDTLRSWNVASKTSCNEISSNFDGADWCIQGHAVFFLGPLVSLLVNWVIELIDH